MKRTTRSMETTRSCKWTTHTARTATATTISALNWLTCIVSKKAKGKQVKKT